MKFAFLNKRKNVPDAVEEKTEPTLKFFFKLLFRKFSKLVTLNLMMLFTVIPFIAVFFIYFFSSQSYSQIAPEFASLLGVHTVANSASASLELELNLAQMGAPLLNGFQIGAIIFCAVFLIATWGWQNVGATYVVREMLSGKPSFVWSDYFYAIKRNFKQSFFFGIFDSVIIAVLALDFVQLYFSNSDFMESMMFFIICAIIVLYAVMRMYLYLMMITFDLSFKKLLKNALIFSVLGFKRNFMAALGVIVLLAIHILLIVLLLPYGIAIPIILPLLYALALITFISAYAAFPVIKKYMIDPYEDENADTDDEQAKAEA